MAVEQTDKFWFGSPDWSDRVAPADLTVSAGITRSGFPETNLLTQHPSDRWRITNVTNNIQIDLDRGTEAGAQITSPVAFIGMMGSNCTRSATWRIRLATTPAEITSGPLVDTAGVFGPAGLFVGNESATATGTGTHTSFTMSGWFKFEHNGFQNLMRRTGSDPVATLRVNAIGKVEFVGVDNPNVGLVTSTTTVQPDTWYHIAGTYSAASDRTRIIINGVQEAETMGVTAFSTGNNINVSPGGNNSRLFVNDLRYWDIERTPAQIAGDYLAPLTPPVTNLVNYWPIEDSESFTGNHFNDTASTNDLSFDGTAPHFAWPDRFWSTSDLIDKTERHSRYYDLPGALAGAARIDFFDPTFDTSAEDLHFSRIFIAEGAPFIDLNISYGSDFGAVEDRSRVSRTSRGLTIVNPASIVDQLNVRYATNSVEHAEQIQKIARKRGGSRDVVAMRNPNGKTWHELGLVWGLMNSRQRQTEDEFSYFRGRLTFTERTS